MARFEANYRVVLHSELPACEAAFYSVLGAELAGAGGTPLYLLTCTEVSFDNPVYLEAKVFKESEAWLVPVFIPHELVLVVSGPADAYPAGFAA
jgi:hypothetical protein